MRGGKCDLKTESAKIKFKKAFDIAKVENKKTFVYSNCVHYTSEAEQLINYWIKTKQLTTDG